MSEHLQTFRIVEANLDGTGPRRTQCYDMLPVADTHYPAGPRLHWDYWAAVTDVTCPACEGGTVRWAEAGYVPGYRICDGCGRHFLARGDGQRPTLLRVDTRRGGR